MAAVLEENDSEVYFQIGLSCGAFETTIPLFALGWKDVLPDASFMIAGCPTMYVLRKTHIHCRRGGGGGGGGGGWRFFRLGFNTHRQKGRKEGIPRIAVRFRQVPRDVLHDILLFSKQTSQFCKAPPKHIFRVMTPVLLCPVWMWRVASVARASV